VIIVSNERQDTILARFLAAGGDPDIKRAAARDLLQRFGTLRGMARSPTERLRQVGSLTPRDIDLIHTLRDTLRAIEDDPEDLWPVMPSPRALHAYLVERHTCPQVGATSRAILLDHTLHMVGDIEVHHGTPAKAAQVVVQEMLSRQAAGAILVRIQATERVELFEGLKDTLCAISRALHLVGATLMQVAIATPSGLFPVSDETFSARVPF
jgi:DNA repair protein RadC